jgi:hypothetical protein
MVAVTCAAQLRVELGQWNDYSPAQAIAFFVAMQMRE